MWRVMVYVSDGVNSMRRHDWEDEEMEVIWVQVKMRKLQVLIEMHIDHWCFSSMDGQLGCDVRKGDTGATDSAGMS